MFLYQYYITLYWTTILIKFQSVSYNTYTVLYFNTTHTMLHNILYCIQCTHVYVRLCTRTYEQHNISCYDNNKISKHFAQRDTPYFNIDLTIVIERNSIEREKERERERERERSVSEETIFLLSTRIFAGQCIRSGGKFWLNCTEAAWNLGKLWTRWRLCKSRAAIYDNARARAHVHYCFPRVRRLRERNKLPVQGSILWDMSLKLAGLSSDIDDFWLRSIVRDGLLPSRGHCSRHPLLLALFRFLAEASIVPCGKYRIFVFQSQRWFLLYLNYIF
mgnify:CR=1 FL=1